MQTKQNINNLKSVMYQEQIDACIIPMFDPHLSEYVAEHWRVIKWLSGFTGSAGTIVVTHQFAGLWTDSRYFIQAEEQLKGSGIELVKLKTPHTPEFIEWIYENLPKGSKIAFDGKVFPLTMVNQMQAMFKRKEFIIHPECDIHYALWKNRPEVPHEKVFTHELKFAGKSRSEKLLELRVEMKKQGYDYQILSSLDDIAWLFNIRGNDIAFVPITISYAIITQKEALLFINKLKLEKALRDELENDGIKIYDYNEVTDKIKKIEKSKSVSIQFSKTNYSIYNAIPKECVIGDKLNISTWLKSVKNETEIKNIKETMVKDGIAMVRFFKWLFQSIKNEKITEISASNKLREFRSQQEEFFDESFTPISAYNAHAAMPHYNATPETDFILKPEGIYLIDSGGQYYGGTTDITRTISLGNPTDRQKTDFTLALKGTIGLAMAVFPYGTKGYQLDYIARKYLWDNKLNYGHGTGHGVGYFLSVHEGPQSIGTSASSDPNTILTPGMLISDEPAFYREGEYGFRTENLMLVVEDQETEYGSFLNFETVTLCPIDTKLIKKELMEQSEIDWLNQYHQIVFDKLSPLLNSEEKSWLKEQTRPI